MHRKKVEQQYSIILVSWCLSGKIPEKLPVFYTIWTASRNRYNFFLFLVIFVVKIKPFFLVSAYTGLA